MINVGREFEINKNQWRSYTVDYLVAMGAAAIPWILVALYYIFAVAPPELQIWKNIDVWKETFLLSRYAAPTSAGILFTMLAAAGLSYTWVYKKVQVLAMCLNLLFTSFFIGYAKKLAMKSAQVELAGEAE